MANIAFIGLGNMGMGMCLNLVKAGHLVTAYDLDKEAVGRAELNGARAASSVAEAVRNAGVVVTMLPNGSIVNQVYLGADGAATSAQLSTLFIDCSTISVGEARSVAKRANELGFAMVDAPVSGGTAAADAGTLTFMAGGVEGAFDRAKPILEAMGSAIVYAGGSGNGQVAKIANNMLLGISMIGTCEAFVLAEKLGLDAQTFFDVSSKASGQNWSMTSYCPAPGPVPSAPSNNDYKPGFAVDMMLKDLRLAMEASRESQAQIKLGAMAEELYTNLSKSGQGDADFSVILKSIALADRN